MPHITKSIKYQCRPENKLTNHAIMTDSAEYKLPQYMELIQCQSCGVMGIAVLDKETAYDAEI